MNMIILVENNTKTHVGTSIPDNNNNKTIKQTNKQEKSKTDFQ